MTFIRPKINSSSLIEEVRKRPCLYDNKGVHGNHELKNAAWGEIGQGLFNEKWHDFPFADKDAMVKDMQVKWKSLRDNYSRQLRIQDQAKAGVSPHPPKKYIYMDQLSFLSPFINKRDKVMISDDISNFSTDSMFVTEDTKPTLTNITSSGDPMEVSTSQPQLQFVPLQPRTFPGGTLTPIDINTLNSSSLGFGDQETPMKKVAKCLDELINMQKEDKSDDPMGNKKFLLSLLPFMKKLPDDVNLEVRLQLMSILDTYTSGKSLQT